MKIEGAKRDRRDAREGRKRTKSSTVHWRRRVTRMVDDRKDGDRMWKQRKQKAGRMAG